VDGQRIVASDGGALSGGNKFTLTRNTDTIVRCRLLTADPDVAFKPESGSTYFFAIDNSFHPDDADPVISQNSEFNITTPVQDWADLDIVNGLISWRINTATTNLLAKFVAASNPASLNMVAELWMTGATATRSAMLGQFDCVMKNIVGDIDADTTLASTSNAILRQDVANNLVIMLLPDGTPIQTWGPTA